METEITKKIRSAIENKLIELDAFVDKELPEYIMVMVANKKTKEQMDDDLSLFLGKNVSKFTTWLLKALHGEKSNKNNNEPRKSAKSNVTASQPSYDEDVLALDAQEQETDEFLQKELDEDPTSQKKIDEVKPAEAENSMDKEDAKSTAHQEVDKDIGRVTARDVFQKQTSSSIKIVKLLPDPKNSHSKISSSVVKLSCPAQDLEDAEYDPQNPSINIRSVASKVLPPVRRSSIPLSRQANKLILLKAVDEANKSVLSKRKLEEVYNPTPIKVLASSINHHHQTKKLHNEYKPSPLLKTIIPHNDIEEEEKYVPQPYVSWHAQEKSSSLFANVDEELNYEDHVPETVGRKVIFNTDVKISSIFMTPKKSSNAVAKIEEGVDRPVSPHFVVTLDGYGPSSNRKRSLSQSDTSDREDMDVMDNSHTSAVFEVETSTKKLKVPEKCHFWPSCKNGDKCEFHHPTTPCKTFPNCKFGSKCLFVHPKCKFDTLCTRKDCLFTHTCKKDFLVTKSLPPPNPYIAQFIPMSQPFNPSPAKCKFFPNCTAFKCQFFHPKPCRYGNDCQSPSCTYIHSRFPAPNKLKWRAEASI